VIARKVIRPRPPKIRLKSPPKIIDNDLLTFALAKVKTDNLAGGFRAAIIWRYLG
jgi:hypothetical protein